MRVPHLPGRPLEPIRVRLGEDGSASGLVQGVVERDISAQRICFQDFDLWGVLKWCLASMTSVAVSKGGGGGIGGGRRPDPVRGRESSDGGPESSMKIALPNPSTWDRDAATRLQITCVSSDRGKARAYKADA